MAEIGFDEDIRTIFEPFAGCMRNVNIATPDGVFAVDLLEYESVKRLSQFILTAIRGHNPATPTAHPMPPGRPLDDEEIQRFADWVEAGMPRTREEE